MEMRIKKRPSLSKIQRNPSQTISHMSMTSTTAFFSSKQTKLPPLRPNMRLTSVRFAKKQQKQRIETQTTLVSTNMLQSYYQTVEKGWVKPSQYLNQIQSFKLIEESNIDMKDYQIKLNEKMEKNMAKLDMLMGLMEKWVNILRKILQYTSTKKSNSAGLMEEVKFWRALSKKFDELQYEFNNQKISQLLVLMKNSLKTKPQYSKIFQQFISLRNKITQTTPLLRKLYLSLEQSITGNIQRFTQNSNIVTSTEYLIRILLGFQFLAQNNEIIKSRMEIVYDKMNDSMIQKLTVSPLYPRELANISSIKQKYSVIDKALSFYSNLIAAIEEFNQNGKGSTETLERVQYSRNVLVNLLQIMGYFEFLYKRKQVLQFSKLFSRKFDFNIFDAMYKDQWQEYMVNVYITQQKVNESMSKKKYDP